MGWVERGVSIVAGISVMAGVSVLVARSDVSQLRGSVTVSIAATASPKVSTPKPLPATATPATAAPVVATKTDVGAVTTIGNASLRSAPSLRAKSKGPVPTGVLSAVIGQKAGFYHVFTPRENTGWIHASKVKTHRKSEHRAHDLRSATIVIDPGHGGHLPGAVGKGGLTEKDANLAISRRMAENLKEARVFLTRATGHAGLRYRAALANRLGADVFVSVHNNALPDRISKTPGTEVYYSQRPGSKRLAGLLYEELVKVLRKYDIKWGRDPMAGAKYRLSQQHGRDYYAVLRRSFVPAVIVEGMFITNPQEERLLRQPKVRQEVADALSRAVRRYFLTDDPGSGYVDPYAKPTPNCKIPGCFEHRK